MITLERFELKDYTGFAGAEPFKDGNQPLCGRFEVKYIGRLEKSEYLLVCDKNGIQVFSNDADDDSWFQVPKGEEVNLLTQLKPVISGSDFGQFIESGILL